MVSGTQTKSNKTHKLRSNHFSSNRNKFVIIWYFELFMTNCRKSERRLFYSRHSVRFDKHTQVSFVGDMNKYLKMIKIEWCISLLPECVIWMQAHMKILRHVCLASHFYSSNGFFRLIDFKQSKCGDIDIWLTSTNHKKFDTICDNTPSNGLHMKLTNIL